MTIHALHVLKKHELVAMIAMKNLHHPSAGRNRAKQSDARLAISCLPRPPHRLMVLLPDSAPSRFRTSLHQSVRRLKGQCTPSPKGKPWWDRTSVWAMLKNRHARAMRPAASN
jgi:hypothetical protein